MQRVGLAVRALPSQRPACGYSPLFCRSCRPFTTHPSAPTPNGQRRWKHRAAPRQLSKSPSVDGQLVPDLDGLRLADLGRVARLCGCNSSGTKSAVKTEIRTALAEHKTSLQDFKHGARILSCDMGVRNLAYCLLVVGEGGPGQAVPELAAWERLNLIDPEDGSPDFSAPAMAKVAVSLVRDVWLPLRPTHVLIERQRSRSGGHAAVFEWTLRVNSLEAMLHALLADRLTRAGKDNDAASLRIVRAVSPQQVVKFITLDDLKPSAGKSKAADVKDIKEAFVAKALVDSTTGSTGSASRNLLTFDSNNSVRAMVDAFLVRRGAKESGKRHSTKEAGAQLLTLKKIDDLADSLAQGLVWLEWARYKTELLERPEAALLDSKERPS